MEIKQLTGDKPKLIKLAGLLTKFAKEDNCLG